VSPTRCVAAASAACPPPFDPQLAKQNGLTVTPSRTEHMQLLGADRAGIVFNKNYDRIPITLRETFG